MKIKKLLIAISLAIATVFAVCAFAACGDKEPEDTTPYVVAEATGHADWGYKIELLYQEYSDGNVVVTIAYYGYEGGTDMAETDKGTIQKGTDEDGDPFVKLTMSTIEMGGETSTSTIDPMTTNTYDQSTGAYTITYNWSLFGYNTQSVTLDVVKVSTPTNVTTWLAQYIPA